MASLVVSGAFALAMIVAAARAAVVLPARTRIPLHFGSVERCLEVPKRAGLVIWPAAGLAVAGVLREHVLESISAGYRRFGYQRIETPALEHIDRLSSGEGGDNEKLIFEVLRRGLPPEVPAGTPLRELVDLGLRYDLTVPLTRFYGNNHASLPMPFRSLQVGPVWRADRPQRGRYRQFYQCDIDMIGEPSVLAEAEQIEATTEALAAIGLTGLTVRLSDRRFLAALAADCGVPADRQDAFFI